MVSCSTWPHPDCNDKDATKIIVDEMDLGDDVVYGKTKLFIR